MLDLIKVVSVGIAMFLAVPIASAATYTTVTQTVSVTTVQGSADVNVQCPNGTTPISGGWRIGNPNGVNVALWSPGVASSNSANPFLGNLPRFVPAGSFPDGQGWHVYGYTNGPIIIQFYAVCATA